MSEYKIKELIAELTACPKKGNRSIDAKIAIFRGGSGRYVADGPPGHYRIEGSGFDSGILISAKYYTTSIGPAWELIPVCWYGRVEPWFDLDLNDQPKVVYHAYCLKPDWGKWRPDEDSWINRVDSRAPNEAVAIAIAAFMAMEKEGLS